MTSNFSVMIRKMTCLGMAVLASGVLLSACTYNPGDPRTETKDENEYTDYEKRKTVFGEGGLNFFGSDSDTNNGGGALGVNSFLWRASLETISFMPINTADAFGGVIITDWYSPPESPEERFKLNVYILGRTLRADGVKVSVFRQLRDRSGGWADATVPNGTAPKVEDSILTKARMLRHQTLTSQ
ncbi:MAG: DUF3576 domain-containing protein [Rhodospirillales bacterium]